MVRDACHLVGIGDNICSFRRSNVYFYHPIRCRIRGGFLPRRTLYEYPGNPIRQDASARTAGTCFERQTRRVYLFKSIEKRNYLDAERSNARHFVHGLNSCGGLCVGSKFYGICSRLLRRVCLTRRVLVKLGIKRMYYCVVLQGSRYPFRFRSNVLPFILIEPIASARITLLCWVSRLFISDLGKQRPRRRERDRLGVREAHACVHDASTDCTALGVTSDGSPGVAEHRFRYKVKRKHDSLYQ